MSTIKFNFDDLKVGHILQMYEDTSKFYSEYGELSKFIVYAVEIYEIVTINKDIKDLYVTFEFCENFPVRITKILRLKRGNFKIEFEGKHLQLAPYIYTWSTKLNENHLN